MDINSRSEQVALLSDSESDLTPEPGRRRSLSRSERKPNPLPWAQLWVVLFIEVTVALTSFSTQPYINEFVEGLGIVGGDKAKTGYYVGIIESTYNLAFTITVLHWNRLSDYVGRKPVLLIGMSGSVVSMLCFGLSRTFWGLVASQCLWGLLDGYISVLKSVVGEITDSTNRATGFSLVFVLWAVGGSIGSVIGGTLARPHERFPVIFGGEFWVKYPYFLPCLAVSLFMALGFIITLIFFKETITEKSVLDSCRPSGDGSLSSPVKDEPLPVRELLIYPVIIAILNFLTLDFLNTCHASLLPLFFSMPIEIGGLGLDPVVIGYILGGYRAFTAVFMGTACQTIIHRYGERQAFITAIFGILASMIVFPAINVCARLFGVSISVWVGIIFLTLPMACTQMGFTCVFIFITAAAPNKRSLGATNGLAQAIVSAARILAPATATSLFSLSVERKLLGGYAVYAVFLILSCFAVLLALKLPDHVRPAWEEGSESDDYN